MPVINRPTRVTTNSTSLIDHILKNQFQPKSTPCQGIMATDISGHYTVFPYTLQL